MACEKQFSFRYIPNKSFSAFDAKSSKEFLQKWGLAQRMKLQVFSYNKYFQAYEKEKFVMNFFQDQSVQEHLEIASSLNTWGPIGNLKADRAEVEIVQSNVTNMGFFDKIFTPGLVRDSGSICKCYDEQLGDFLISDELRKMVLSDESDFFDLFMEKEKSEFLFCIFKHLCLGGQVCQRQFFTIHKECHFYGSGTKEVTDHNFHLGFSVHKDAATKQLTISSIVLQVSLWANDVMVYPSSQPHVQSFAYFMLNPAKRNVFVWHHSWKS
eukprot:gene10840-11992_t